jgi:hypothetical protein
MSTSDLTGLFPPGRRSELVHIIPAVPLLLLVSPHSPKLTTSLRPRPSLPTLCRCVHACPVIDTRIIVLIVLDVGTRHARECRIRALLCPPTQPAGAPVRLRACQHPSLYTHTCAPRGIRAYSGTVTASLVSYQPVALTACFALSMLAVSSSAHPTPLHCSRTSISCSPSSASVPSLARAVPAAKTCVTLVLHAVFVRVRTHAATQCLPRHHRRLQSTQLTHRMHHLRPEVLAQHARAAETPHKRNNPLLCLRVPSLRRQL